MGQLLPTTPQGPVAVSRKGKGAKQSTWHHIHATKGPRDEVETLMSRCGPLMSPPPPTHHSHRFRHSM